VLADLHASFHAADRSDGPARRRQRGKSFSTPSRQPAGGRQRPARRPGRSCLRPAPRPPTGRPLRGPSTGPSTGPTGGPSEGPPSWRPWDVLPGRPGVRGWEGADFPSAALRRMVAGGWSGMELAHRRPTCRRRRGAVKASGEGASRTGRHIDPPPADGQDPVRLQHRPPLYVSEMNCPLVPGRTRAPRRCRRNRRTSSASNRLPRPASGRRFLLPVLSATTPGQGRAEDGLRR
jgi:hypothetical protein